MLPESSSFVMLGLQVRWVFSGYGSADLRPLGWAQAVENLAEQSLDFLLAAASMLRAKPDTTMSLDSNQPAVKQLAIGVPKDDALRAPTTTIASRLSHSGLPKTHRKGGASVISTKRLG